MSAIAPKISVIAGKKILLIAGMDLLMYCIDIIDCRFKF